MAINLLPHEAAKKEAQERVRRVSSLGAIALLVGVGAISTGVFIFRMMASREVAALEKKIKEQRERIVAQKDIELKALTLEKKMEVLGGVLTNAPHFSVLMGTLQSLTPAEVSITNLSVLSAERATISGVATSYLGLARFIRSLRDPASGGKFFSEVDLRSVSLDAQGGLVKFSLETDLVPKSLRK